MDAASLSVRAAGDPLIIAVPGPGPYTTPALTANLFFRVFLAIVANLVCLVPLRLLHRNGEFAAVVFILSVELKNLETILNSLIWRDDDVENWFPGYGLCDMGSFFDNFINGVYATCLLAIMRNLAEQVGLMRANPMTAGEKRQRNMVQALIIFPVPLIMVGMTWPLSAQRYAVGTLVGCLWVAHPSWPYLLTFVLPHILIPLATAGYALLTYLRYREIAKTTESALSRNRIANHRAQRTRRRLYLMVMSIMAPFLPMTILMFVNNVLAVGSLTPFDYDQIHNHASPYPWNSVTYVTSGQITFQLMNVPYIAVLTAIPIFAFFGMTKDAMNDYRRLLLCVGLGRVFPRLREEYDPDRSVRSDFSISLGSTAVGSDNTRSSSKLISMISSNPLASFSSTSSRRPRSNNFQPMPDLEQGNPPPPPPSSNIQSPPPAHQASPTSTRGLLSRNPFLFRTTLDLPIPFFSSSKTGEQQQQQQQQQQPSAINMDNLPQRQPAAENWPDPSGISTRVWSDEERHADRGRTADRRSVSSADGVVVETLLTRETEAAQGSQQPR